MSKRAAELDDPDRKPGFKGHIFGLPVYEKPPACDHAYLYDGERGIAGEPVVYCALCGRIMEWPPK